jgi:hypothetical protein
LTFGRHDWLGARDGSNEGSNEGLVLMDGDTESDGIELGACEVEILVRGCWIRKMPMIENVITYL